MFLLCRSKDVSKGSKGFEWLVVDEVKEYIDITLLFENLIVKESCLRNALQRNEIQ
jgi:hypothetical protein